MFNSRSGRYKLIEGSPGHYSDWFLPPIQRADDMWILKQSNRRREQDRHSNQTMLFDIDGWCIHITHSLVFDIDGGYFEVFTYPGVVIFLKTIIYFCPSELNCHKLNSVRAYSDTVISERFHSILRHTQLNSHTIVILYIDESSQYST